MVLRRSLHLGSALLCAVCCLTPTASAQQVGWAQVAYSINPSARSASGITYDPATASVVLFGGADGNAVLGDTWTWDGVWRPKFPASAPAPRQGPAIAFDRAAGNVVLFGGAPTVPVGDGTAFGDTWTWDGVNWTQQFPPVSPPARTWSNMAYVPATKTVLLFSGTNTPNGDDALCDTWAWDGVAKTWTELQPATHPPGRAMNQLVYDEATRTVVLFGGVTTNLAPLNDTWTWDGSNWRPHFQGTTPAPRNGPALAFDTVLGKVVLFGGAVGTCCSDSLSDTWTWDGSAWTEIYPEGVPPSARNAANMGYDPGGKVLLLFGGDNDAGSALDTTFVLTVSH